MKDNVFNMVHDDLHAEINGPVHSRKFIRYANNASIELTITETYGAGEIPKRDNSKYTDITPFEIAVMLGHTEPEHYQAAIEKLNQANRTIDEIRQENKNLRKQLTETINSMSDSRDVIVNELTVCRNVNYELKQQNVIDGRRISELLAAAQKSAKTLQRSEKTLAEYEHVLKLVAPQVKSKLSFPPDDCVAVMEVLNLVSPDESEPTKQFDLSESAHNNDPVPFDNMERHVKGLVKKALNEYTEQIMKKATDTVDSYFQSRKSSLNRYISNEIGQRITGKEMKRFVNEQLAIHLASDPDQQVATQTVRFDKVGETETKTVETTYQPVIKADGISIKTIVNEAIETKLGKIVALNR